MPRQLLIKTDQFPYHICARSNNMEWFNIPMGEVWGIFLHHLEFTCKKFEVEVICYALMSNHYHLFLRTPKANIDQAMHNFNHKLALDIGQKSNRINRIFGGRYKWSLVQSDAYFLAVYRYIYQNPLRAKICTDVMHYPFHSMNEELSGHQYLYDDELEFGNATFHSAHEKTIWLNGLYSEDQNEQMRKGLKKAIYRPVIKRKY